MLNNNVPLLFNEHPFNIKNGKQGIALANKDSIVIIPLDVEHPSMVTLWFQYGIFLRSRILQTTAEMGIDGRPGVFSREYVFSGSGRILDEVLEQVTSATNAELCNSLDTMNLQRRATERYIAKNPLAQKFALARARRVRVVSGRNTDSDIASHLLAAGAGYVVGNALFGEGDESAAGEDIEGADDYSGE